MNLRTTTKRLSILPAASALAVTAACGGSSDNKSGSSSDPLQVVYVSGITGLLAPSAKAIERGIEAKIADINASGGINGRKVELTVKDNQSDPTRGATLIQKELTSGTKPDLVIPGVSSNEALAAAPLLARAKVVGINSISSPLLDDPAKFPYTVSQSVTTNSILKAGIDYIYTQSTPKKIALIVPNDAVGDATAGSFKLALEGKNVESTTIRFASDGVDYTPAFQKAKQFNPDWIVMDGAGTQAASLIDGRLKASTEDIPTLVGVVASSQPLLKLAQGEALKNLYATILPSGAYIEPADRGPEFEKFFKRVNDQGALEVPLSTYASGWDYVGIWENAVKSIKGTLTGEKIKSALETVPRQDDPQFPQYSGNYSAKSHFHPGDVSDYTFGAPETVKDGMYVVKAQ
ncbi:MAG: hypothetical protein JWP10_1167 [Nocardioidaceae bacterium]|nr:hypothetical protein [Nocardioidaceae bacterium]